MAKRCRFVFNRKAFSQQVLKNETLRSRMRDAAEAAVEDDRCMVRDHDGKNRSGVAIICPAPVEKAHAPRREVLAVRLHRSEALVLRVRQAHISRQRFIGVRLVQLPIAANAVAQDVRKTLRIRRGLAVLRLATQDHGDDLLGFSSLLEVPDLFLHVHRVR